LTTGALLVTHHAKFNSDGKNYHPTLRLAIDVSLLLLMLGIASTWKNYNSPATHRQ
jgi:hypothetical protein